MKLDVCIVPSTGGQVKTLAGPLQLVQQLAWSPDGKRLLLILKKRKGQYQWSKFTVFMDPETGATTPFNAPGEGVSYIDWR